MQVETFELPIGLLEYIDETHTYVFEGEVLPSVTQIIADPGDYAGVSEQTLREAAEKGTAMHNAIEQYEKYGTENDEIIELRHYKFLKKNIGFKVLESEIPVVLFKDGNPIAAGRLDQLIELNGKKGINDLKRTSTFNYQKVAMQTTLYAMAYKDTYGEAINFLSGTHLRENERHFHFLLPARKLVEKKIEDFFTK